MKNYRKIARVLGIILIANILVATIKTIIAIISGSNSLLADGYHALADSSSNIIGLIAVYYASRPADETHPYGHHKFETLASLLIGITLVLISGGIIVKAGLWFWEPQTPQIGTINLIILVITLIVNIIIAYFEFKQGKELKSEVLIADSLHTRSDILISGGVLLSLLLIKFGAPRILDPIISFLISILIFISALKIFKESIPILVDKSMVSEETIIKIIKETVSEVVDVHKIRSRSRGDKTYIDLHLLVSPEKTVREAHELNHQLEKVIARELKRNIEFIAHIEPIE